MKSVIKRIIIWVVGCAFLFTPPFFFLIGGYLLYEIVVIHMNGISTHGIIVDYSISDNTSDGTSYYPVVEYTTLDHEALKVVSPYGWSTPSTEPEIIIRYRRGSPQKFHIKGASHILPSLLFILLGIAGILVEIHFFRTVIFGKDNRKDPRCSKSQEGVFLGTKQT